MRLFRPSDEACLKSSWITGLITPFAGAPVLIAPHQHRERRGLRPPVPDLSAEVDDFDDVLECTKAAGYAIEYGPQQET
jgi:hypothetical protein